MSESELSQRLGDIEGTLGLRFSGEQHGRLLEYLALLHRWNKVYNLTAVREPDEMLTLHLADSLAVLGPLRRWLAQRAGTPDVRLRVLDVGSGAGLPGVVLAIACPELEVSCVDTVGKKAAFIQQVASALKLSNLRGVHARVESLTEGYDLVCSRAFASLEDFVTWSAGCLGGDGVWLAMKGKVPTAEMASLPQTVEVFHVEQLKVPGLDAERCLVWLRPRGAQNQTR